MSARLKPRPVRIVPSRDRAAKAAALVLCSWWGLTASFTDYADRLAAAGITAGLSDLMEGQTPRTEAAARALRKAPRAEPMYRSLQRDLRDLREAAGTESVAVIGFSMGAHWAVWLSQQPNNPIRHVVLYYGARGGDFSNSRASYLAHFAGDDPWVSASARRSMERALARAARPCTSCDYPGTGHWFAEPAQRGSFDAVAAERAFARTLDFLA